MENFKKRFNKLLTDKFGRHPNLLRPEANFSEDLGADILDMVELMLEFENEFNIAISDDEAEKITTLGEAETYIKEKIKNSRS
ncbi:acyl carrier protein [Olleya marilimosa]|uniref:acyl carrier protein n=1 Tax=Olleya marilimosa TaxID=272164 RepID=UPI000684E206|nr:acyl carrier protein [Olleya marilimosa]|tara:strand:+ start:394 stop:642 length:249 start_codon:yes stop_codon:yes gene_type:complete